MYVVVVVVVVVGLVVELVVAVLYLCTYAVLGVFDVEFAVLKY